MSTITSRRWKTFTPTLATRSIWSRTDTSVLEKASVTFWRSNSNGVPFTLSARSSTQRSIFVRIVGHRSARLSPWSWTAGYMTSPMRMATDRNPR